MGPRHLKSFFAFLHKIWLPSYREPERLYSCFGYQYRQIAERLSRKYTDDRPLGKDVVEFLLQSNNSERKSAKLSEPNG